MVLRRFMVAAAVALAMLLSMLSVAEYAPAATVGTDSQPSLERPLEKLPSIRPSHKGRRHR